MIPFNWCLPRYLQGFFPLKSEVMKWFSFINRKAHCEFSEEGNGGIAGVCCIHCNMGPCTLGEVMGYEYGACGATADTILAHVNAKRKKLGLKV